MEYSNSNPERFKQDESGQWWYYPPCGNNRNRAYRGTCEQCLRPFLSKRLQPCCTPACGREHLRKVTPQKPCENCGKLFTPQFCRKDIRRFCSHSCAAQGNLGVGPVTTPNIAPVLLKNSDNPRFYRDDRGQWWYQTLGPKKSQCPRIRAFIRTCQRCGRMFLGHKRTQHARTKNAGHFCGIKCANSSIKAETRNTKRGPANKNWRGGRYKTKDGYIRVWAVGHPALSGKSAHTLFEHRLVMEKMLGRPLLPLETVHHKNGRRADNRSANLELWSKKHPYGQRVTDLLEFARWVLETYGPIEDKLKTS